MEPTIVRADLRHVDLIAPLFDAYRQFYKQPSDLEGARRFLRERIGRDESVILAAMEGEGPAARGLGFTQLYPSFSSVGMTRIWILNDLFVAADARRGGVGRALMVAAHDFARGRGAAKVELATAKDNAGARALYEELGYLKDEAFDRYELIL